MAEHCLPHPGKSVGFMRERTGQWASSSEAKAWREHTWKTVSMFPFLGGKKISPACFSRGGTVLWSQNRGFLDSLTAVYASSSGFPET